MVGMGGKTQAGMSLCTISVAISAYVRLDSLRAEEVQRSDRQSDSGEASMIAARRIMRRSKREPFMVLQRTLGRGRECPACEC